MKRLLLLLTMALVPSLSLAGPQDRTGAAVNRLGADLYNHLKAEPTKNLCISPYSLATAIAMTAVEAQGKTRQEMLATLHLAGSAPETVGDLRPPLLEGAREMEYQDANAIYVQRGVGFGAGYSRLLEQRFSARVSEVDFQQAPERARNAINHWVERSTHDRIQNLIATTPGPGTLAILVNAVYMKAKWAEPFECSETSPAPFHTGEGGTVSVPMMKKTMQVAVKEQLDCTLFALPYKGSKYDFVVIFPNRCSSLTSVGRRLGGKLSKPVGSFAQKEVFLHLPKFKIQGETLNLNEPLQKMGMRRAFTDDAEFGGIPDGPARKFKVTSVLQKTFIEVDESGTEAAAATALVEYKCALPSNPKEIIVDRPFFFAIQHRETGTCLFLGAVCDPSQN